MLNIMGRGSNVNGVVGKAKPAETEAEKTKRFDSRQFYILVHSVRRLAAASAQWASRSRTPKLKERKPMTRVPR